jgi:hypothetical protein
MGAENVTIKPKSTPPKPGQRAKLLQHQQAQVDAAQFQAATTDSKAIAGLPEGAAPIETEFLDPAKMPELLKAAPQPSISNVDLAAGIPSPVAPEQIVDSQAAESRKVITPTPPPAASPPPKTREQYIAQQRNDTGAYPDVTQIFAGQIPGHTPINNPLDALKHVPPPPPVVREVVVTHEPPPLSAAYQLTKKFAGFLVDSFVEFDKGQVIYEPYVIQELLRGGFDGLVPVDVAASFMTCPACQHQFPAEASH